VPSTNPHAYSHRIDSHPAHHATGTLTRDERNRQLAGDVDRELADAVEPHAGRQRDQDERQDLDGAQQAHLRRARAQQHRRRQR
jgi:hypothetical protein